VASWLLLLPLQLLPLLHGWLQQGSLVECPLQQLVQTCWWVLLLHLSLLSPSPLTQAWQKQQEIPHSPRQQQQQQQQRLPCQAS
jgi:hypothetical protein